MDLIFQSSSHIILTENHIRQLHRDLLKYSPKDDHHKGEYKKINNNILAFDEEGKQIGIVFATASPFHTPRLMNEIIFWVNDTLENKALHPLLAIAVFVVVFLQIHPFQDGNGRLSRVITTLMLLRAGYSYVHYSSLESVIEQARRPITWPFAKLRGQYVQAILHGIHGDYFFCVHYNNR